MGSKKLEWAEKKFGGEHLDLPVGRIGVSWDGIHGKGYEVSVFGRDLKKAFEDFDEAKEAGIRVAKKVLKESLEQLEQME